MNIDDEKKTLAQLEAKLAEAMARATELQASRRQLSFAANTGDDKARKALDDANAASAGAALEIENMRSAIDEALLRLRAAEQAAQDEENRQKAKRALALSASIEARGKRLDDALLALAVEAEGLEEDLSELNYRMGIAYPSLANFRAIVERPFFAGLMFQPSGKKKANGQPADSTLRLRHLPPGERMTFAEITEGYAKTIRRTASMILGDKSEAA